VLVAISLALAHGVGAAGDGALDELRDRLERYEVSLAEKEAEIDAFTNDLALQSKGGKGGAEAEKRLRATVAEAEGASLSRFERPTAAVDGGEEQACTTGADCRGAKSACVDGRCVCTVLSQGADCTEPLSVEGEENACVTGLRNSRFWSVFEGKYITGDVAMRAPTDDYERHVMRSAGLAGGADLTQAVLFDTCAVVGSSGVVKRSQRGAEIDAHSAVIRFNDAPTGTQHAPFVGNRTSLRIQNMDICGFAERQGELCLAYTSEPGKECIRSSLHGRPKCTVLMPSFVHSKYLQWYWRVSKPGGVSDPACRPKCGQKTSAGFYGVLLAMNLCGRVDLYGFGASSQSEDKHYFKKPSASWERKDWIYRHHWSFERFCLGAYAAGKIPGVHVWN